MNKVNDNCLEGMMCPNSNCRSGGPYRIAATAIFEVEDDGTGDYQDVEWTAHSFCECVACKHRGTVGEFEKAFDAWEERHGEIDALPGMPKAVGEVDDVPNPA